MLHDDRAPARRCGHQFYRGNAPVLDPDFTLDTDVIADKRTEAGDVSQHIAGEGMTLDPAVLGRRKHEHSVRIAVAGGETLEPENGGCLAEGLHEQRCRIGVALWPDTVGEVAIAWLTAGDRLDADDRHAGFERDNPVD